MLHKILIANRGEIACRIIETCQKLGIKTVAVYSEADRHALFAKKATEAYLLGPAPAADSYLNQSKIIDIAKKSGAKAIHPGYGFLSENADFAKACEMAGIIFIGPSAKAIETMGDKNKAKHLMQKANVPIAPSYDGDLQNKAALEKAIKTIGLPILVKAAFGGGGRGMRLVTSRDALESAIESAQREAKKSFANGTVFLEKYIQPARHVEVQIFADTKGNIVHLFDRDCSIQRRHQKVIEEAPAPDLKESTRKAMYQAAINAAKAIHYTGAGTIEFLVDEKENFYFMEMNTRLQVEHPVTEMITGIDLVDWQLRVAAGEALPLKQNQIKKTGHAIEVRICAEAPEKEFMPSSGQLIYFEPPTDTISRLDTGVVRHDMVSPYYDSMVAKLIVQADNRQSAINKMMKALRRFYIVGVETNISFLMKILHHLAFQKAELATTFIDQHQKELIQSPQTPKKAILEIAAKAHLARFRHNVFNPKQSNDQYSPWLIRDHWRLITEPLTVSFWINNEWITLTDTEQDIPYSGAFYHDQTWHVFYDGEHYVLPLAKPNVLQATEGEQASEFIAPMPGTVSAVCVKPGQMVKSGEKLMVLEAMKMEHTIRAPYDGTVETIYFNAGDTLNEGAQLLEFSAAN